MFTLRLLGGAALESDDGAMSGRATQRRRLALLALLATAPGHALSRDKLIGYLWPESETEQARHLLSVALYELRRALGEEALLSRGDDVVLGVERVAPDVVELERALDGGDHERAAQLYAGPFLDGFFLSDAPEFERWAEQERARLEHRHREGLEALAEARGAQGDRRGAVEAWRRLAAADPYNSRVAMALMRALADAGDRAGALQHARVHEALLREEYGAEPDAAVAALAERIREEPRAEEPASPAPSTPPPTTRAARHVRAHRGRGRTRGGLALVGALGLLALTAVWSGQREAIPEPEAGAPPVSVAVLPFSDVSPEGGNQYFGDGLTEEIAIALDRAGSLKVVSRSTAALALRRQTEDVREVGRRLNVASVLEGSVRRVDDHLRITTRLVDVGTGYSLWSETYDRRMRSAADVFRVQDEIARAVVGALQVELIGGDTTILVRRSTADLQAYNAYLRGRYQWNRRTPEGFAQAASNFQQAIARDSSYALAYAGLADVYVLLASYDYGVLPPAEAMPRARAAASRALELDPGLAQAHATLANLRATYDRDPAAAERSFRRALELDPGYAPAHHWYSLFLAAQGRTPAARAAMLRARELDPLSLVMSTGLARHFYLSRDYERSIAEYRRALEMDSSFVTAHLGLGLVLAQAGEPRLALAEYRSALSRLGGGRPPVVLALMAHAHARAGEPARARALLRTLEERAAREHVAPEYLALVHMALGEEDQAFRWLERAVEAGSTVLAVARVEPLLDPLRGDPRFAALLRRAGV